MRTAMQTADGMKHGTASLSPGYDTRALPQAPIYALLKSGSEMVEMCEDARRKITSSPPLGGISGH